MISSLSLRARPLGSDEFERYEVSAEGGTATRIVATTSGSSHTSIVLAAGSDLSDPFDSFDAAWLRASASPEVIAPRGEVRIVDLFSGCGAMTLGATEAARAVGLRAKPVLAVDINEAALAVYTHNFPEARVLAGSVTDLLDRDVGASMSASEKHLAQVVGHVDLLIGGPPCQGNSDLNNHTRRRDPKNRLYLTMARFAEIVRPRHILIENVPGVIHDRDRVAQRTEAALVGLGYHVSSRLLSSDRFGVPQRRRRFFIVASLDNLAIDDAVDSMSHRPERSVMWAIGDLMGQNMTTTYDTAARHYAQNQERIRYLFEHDLFDLPNDQRPECHRLKRHSYTSVYGRMHPNRPAPTITGGFGSTGQGRYVHPFCQRSLTPHEAARVQFIPDFFKFPEPRRRFLQELIGNAVPPKLTYVMTLPLLARL